MKQFATVILLFFALSATERDAHAQLPGPGNIQWEIKWEKHAPAMANPQSPDNWMYGEYTFTGLAYDSTRDVLYVCGLGEATPHILAFNAEDGSQALHIGNPYLAGAGQLFIDASVVQGGYGDGLFAIYKVDVDEEGRIYACNLASPGTSFRVYRWDTDTSLPQLVYHMSGTAVTGLMGTAFDVVGKRYFEQGRWRDGVRIFTCTAETVPNNTPDALFVFAADTTSNAPYPYCHTMTISNPVTVAGRYFGSGIAAIGSSPDSAIWVSSPGGVVRKIHQHQTSNTFPQFSNAIVLDTMKQFQVTYSNPGDTIAISGLGGVLAYGTNPRTFYNSPPTGAGISMLIFGDVIPSPSHSRFMSARYSNPWRWDWPWYAGTPLLGTHSPTLLSDVNNFIADIDFKLWVNQITYAWDPTSPNISPQIFYLLSNNGIGSYLQHNLWPDPVELSSFTATIENGTVQLAWSTASETNNYGFNIERSFGGKQSPAWESIGFVEGHGSTTAQQEYTFSDALTPTHEQSGVIQYRLKQTDFDGTFEYSPVVEVSIGSAATEIALYQNYPNPFSGSTSISFTVPSAQPLTLTLYNTLGQPVQFMRQDASQGRNEVQLTGLKPGIYMVVLQTREGAVTRRMVASGR